MKKAFLFSCVVTTVFFYSCTNEIVDDQQKVSLGTDFNSAEVTSPVIREVSAFDNDYIFLTGNFKAITLDSNSVAIYTKTKKLEHLFLLEGSKAPKVAIEKIENLSYLKNGIVINNEHLVSVKGNSNAILKENSRRISDNGISSNLDINNLVHYWRPITINGDEEDILNFAEESATMSISLHEGSCQNGGEGSTGCSITSSTGSGCTVSCGDGYYACCNETAMGPNDCHCDPIMKDPGGR